jgi:hypothetical protein
MKHLLLSIAIGALALGCGSSKSRPKEDSSTETGAGSAKKVAAPEQLVAGDYACAFSNTAEFLCRITEDGDFVSLEKLGGSERFSGSLSAGDNPGEITWTNAAAEGYPPSLTFKRQADGTWFGEVPSDGEKLGYRLRYLGELGSQFGGQAYGGAISAAPGT